LTISIEGYSLHDRHPSPRLINAFKGYQGQDPQDAKFIFFGLDANFAEDIEKSPIFEEVIEYLNDGVTYWKTRNRHHPFLSGAYKKGSYRYHYQFSKLGLTSEYADKVSFVELLNCPTCGNASLKRLKQLLNEDHLSRIDNVMSLVNGDKSVYIARGSYSKFLTLVKRLDASSGFLNHGSFSGISFIPSWIAQLEDICNHAFF
jgi:hypothetical protein